MPSATPESRTDTARSRAREHDVVDRELDAPAPWLLAGLAGGPVLAGSLWMLLRRRRAAQFRHRRPGRTIATPPPALAPVEKTLATVGPDTAPAVEHVDRHCAALASDRAAAHQPMPTLAAVELAASGITLHLDAPRHPPAAVDDPATRPGGPCPPTRTPTPTPTPWPSPAADQPAPYPLLVTIGTSDTGHVWLFNCEDLTLTITGDPTYGADFARYLAAEVACNPWSAGVTLDCVGVATEVAPINPDRIRSHTTAARPGRRGPRRRRQHHRPRQRARRRRRHRPRPHGRRRRLAGPAPAHGRHRARRPPL